MSGDIVEAMAEAISTSEIVVVVFSNDYTSRPNCKKECAMALKKGKLHSFPLNSNSLKILEHAFQRNGYYYLLDQHC